LREALARSDNDFVLSEPRGRKSAPRSGLLGTLAAIVGFVVRLAAYPNRLLGAIVFGLTIAIPVNALLLQHSRHPAPLFHKGITLTAAAPAVAPAAPQAAPAPADSKPESAPAPIAAAPAHDPIAQLLTSEPGAAHAEADDSAQSKAVPHRQIHDGAAAPEAKPVHDQITELLKSNPPSASASASAAEDRPKTVLGVQQALLKLGYVVRPDGQMGTVTRRALEQYERDHGLPVEAALTPKLLRRLASEAHIGIE
jgi:hypothetical protein